MAKPITLYSECLRADGQTYFLDLCATGRHQHYLQLTYSRKQNDAFVQQRIYIAADQIKPFAAAFQRLLEQHHETR